VARVQQLQEERAASICDLCRFGMRFGQDGGGRTAKFVPAPSGI